MTLIRRAQDQGKAQAAMGALALFLASLDWRHHRASRETLLAAVQAQGALAQTADLESTTVFAQLAESVVQLAPEKAEAAYRVVQQNGGLGIALQGLEPRPAHLVQLRAIFQVARTAGDQAVASRVARDFLVPLLARDPAQARMGELGKTVLEALRAAPDGLAQAFSEWKDEDLYDTAVQTLRNWAEGSFAGALDVAARLASETYNGFSDLIRERPSILGMSQALASAGAPAADWLVFALAEAGMIDATDNQEGLRSFREFLAKVKIGKTGIEVSLRRLLDRFHRLPRVSTLGSAHRALVTCLAEPLGRHPAVTAGALAQLFELQGAEFLLWGEAVSVVAAAVSASDPKTASQIARNWWTSLTITALQLGTLPKGSFQMLDLLSAQDATAVLDQWAPKLSALGLHPGAQALVESLEALARRHALGDQEFLCEVGHLSWKLRHEGGDLVTAVEETVKKATQFSQSNAQVTRALARLFPSSPVEFTRDVLGLLVSSRVSPLTKDLLEERFQEKALEELAPWAVPDVLPAIDDLARNNRLLLAVSKKMGRSWPHRREEASAFVRRLVELKRYDALGAFLRGTEDSGEKGFIQDVQDRAPDLYGALRQAAQHPVGRFDLARVKELRVRGAD